MPLKELPPLTHVSNHPVFHRRKERAPIPPEPFVPETNPVNVDTLRDLFSRMGRPPEPPERHPRSRRETKRAVSQLVGKHASLMLRAEHIRFGLRPRLSLRDLWVGIRHDHSAHQLTLMLLPTIGINVQLPFWRVPDCN